jgi:iron complex transport system permease protein
VKPIIYCLLFFGLCATVAAGLGSTSFSLVDAVGTILLKMQGKELNETQSLASTILFEIRFPRMLVAALCGAGLAAAGVLSQGLFRNSLASPSILGTTTGGSLAAAMTFYFGAAYHHWLSLPASAFIGACVATYALYALSRRLLNFEIHTLLLAGFALNALLGACTSLVISLMLEDQQKASAVMHWLMGGFSARGMEHFWMGLIPIVLGVVLALRITIKLDVLSLGEEVAQTLSVDIRSLWRLAVVAIALLVAGSVSIAGAIPFVGLMVPHITRLIFGPQHTRLLTLSMINGASLVLLADLVARTWRAPQETEVGVLISLLGAPFFVWLLTTERTRKLGGPHA